MTDETAKAKPAPAPRTPLDAPAAARATLVGFAAMALFDAIVAMIRDRPASVRALAEREVWGVSAILVAGLALAVDSAILVAIGRRLGAKRGETSKLRRALPYLLLAAFDTVVATAFLDEFLERQAGTLLSGAPATVLLAVLLALFGIGLATLTAVAHAVSGHRWLRFAPVAVGLAGAIVNDRMLRDDYADVHTAAGWAAALAIGFGITPTIAARLQARPGVARALVAAAALWAGFGVLLPAPNGVRLDLFRTPGSGAYASALALWRLPELPAGAVPAGQEAFYLPRTEQAAIAPTARPRDGRAPVVVLVTIDAARADLFQDRRKDALWPTLAKLRDESVVFTRARSPGTQTAISLTAAFSGKYFSQLYWRKGLGGAGLDYPAADESPRFTKLLDEAGVKTVKATAVSFLSNDFGVAPGFREEVFTPVGRKPATASQVLQPLIERIERIGDEPTFVYSHLMEAHGPYRAGFLRTVETVKVLGFGKSASYVQYAGALASLDEWIGKLLAACDRPALAGRVLFVLSADHGEGFGEHRAFQHGKTLYGEMTDIPLFVRGPGIAPREVDEPVGLIDVGPTVLDWMGVPTPGAYMGQSLVPFLLGRDVPLERPIVAEGRLRRSIIVGDVKIIVDERRKVVEAFDLAKDPKERDDLWETDRARALPAAAAYRAFFDAQTLKRPGYTPPYRP